MLCLREIYKYFLIEVKRLTSWLGLLMHHSMNIRSSIFDGSIDRIFAGWKRYDIRWFDRSNFRRILKGSIFDEVRWFDRSNIRRILKGSIFDGSKFDGSIDRISQGFEKVRYSMRLDIRRSNIELFEPSNIRRFSSPNLDDQMLKVLVFVLREVHNCSCFSGEVSSISWETTKLSYPMFKACIPWIMWNQR